MQEEISDLKNDQELREDIAALLLFTPVTLRTIAIIRINYFAYYAAMLQVRRCTGIISRLPGAASEK